MHPSPRIETCTLRPCLTAFVGTSTVCLFELVTPRGMQTQDPPAYDVHPCQSWIRALSVPFLAAHPRNIYLGWTELSNYKKMAYSMSWSIFKVSVILLLPQVNN